MRKPIYFILAGTLWLSSCGIYKKYERPENINTPNIFRDTAVVNSALVTTDTTSLGSTPWREVFTDPYLRQLIDSALVNNTDMRSAALSVKQAKAMLTAAKLSYLPSFTFAPTGTLRSWDFGKASQIYSLPVEASWSVDLFGSLTNAKRAQQAIYLQSQDYQRAVQCGIISGIANMYYTLLMLDKQLEITKNTETLTKQTYDMMVQQKQFAETDESAVMSAEAPHQIKRGKLEDQSLPHKFSVGIPLQILSNRPDVHANEMALANCFYNVNKARSAFYPNITINGSAAWTNNSGGGIVNPGKILSTAVASLVQPIFYRGQLTAALKVAKAQQEQAFLTWQQSVLNAGSEVSNALALYQSSQKRSELEIIQIASLERNVEVAEKMFKMSTNGNYLNVISAQQALLHAQLSKVGDDFNKMQAVVNLYYALGGGDK